MLIGHLALRGQPALLRLGVLSLTAGMLITLVIEEIMHHLRFLWPFPGRQPRMAARPSRTP
jgi:hypothetical protein